MIRVLYGGSYMEILQEKNLRKRVKKIIIVMIKTINITNRN